MAHAVNKDLHLIGSYFVDVYYNVLYAEAQIKKGNKEFPNVTEAYKVMAVTFPRGVEEKAFFKNILNEIYKYYTKFASFISFREFVARICNCFTPSDYQAGISYDKQIGVIHLVLSNACEAFAKVILENYLIAIIDDHKNKDTVQAMIMEMEKLLNMERDKMYQRYVFKEKNPVDKALTTQVLEQRLKDTQNAFDKHKEDVLGIMKKYRQLREKMSETIKRLEKMLTESNGKVAELLAKNKQLQHDLEESKLHEHSPLSDIDSSDQENSQSSTPIHVETGKANEAEKAFTKEMDELAKKADDGSLVLDPALAGASIEISSDEKATLDDWPELEEIPEEEKYQKETKVKEPKKEEPKKEEKPKDKEPKVEEPKKEEKKKEKKLEEPKKEEKAKAEEPKKEEKTKAEEPKKEEKKKKEEEPKKEENKAKSEEEPKKEEKKKKSKKKEEPSETETPPPEEEKPKKEHKHKHKHKHDHEPKPEKETEEPTGDYLADSEKLAKKHKKSKKDKDE